MNNRITKEGRARAIEYLKEWLKPGDRVYTVLRHRAANGMSRRMHVLIAPEQGKIFDISMKVAMACGFRINQNEGSLGVSGAGMDMGFHVVYSLSSVLFGRASNGGEFVCIGEFCPSNDHFNGDKDYTPHLHSNGGYALRHSWL